MIMQDDRGPGERKTHTCLIVGTDQFLSGWGLAKGGKSYAAWACKPEHRSIVLAWVEGRSDMQRVREVSGDYKPSGRGHCHIYVVHRAHPAIAYLNESV